MTDLKVDVSRVYDFVSRDKIAAYEPQMVKHLHALRKQEGPGDDFLGWLTLPSDTPETMLQAIEADAIRIQQMAEIFVVIGIGGSYLGARAVIEALSKPFQSLLAGKKAPTVIYAGQNLSEDYLSNLMELLDQKDYAVTVISKSGTTTEPAVAFRLIKSHLEKKYGIKGARERIVAITDEKKGALRQLSQEQGYSTYVVPDDVGGRFSVLTPVGLLPIAVAGFNIRDLILGAARMQKCCMKKETLDENPAMLYAAARNALYSEGKLIEVMVNYLPALYYISEWWKQLYGESEGKDAKGIFPASVGFTTDLHSLGQYIQEGERKLFETVLSVENRRSHLEIPQDEANLDGLNYLAGRRIGEVNEMARQGTLLAHVAGGVPNILLKIKELNEHNLGQLIYFYELACALSGYQLGVNPFDQPGVEAYKKNMFALLGKPGYEDLTKALQVQLAER